MLPSSVDFVVVGAGVAGLRAAIEIAPHATVLVISKQELTESNTQYAQGGVAVALSDDDEVELHLHDTITAGDGLVNERAAEVLVTDGPERIQELIEWGTKFDREGTRLTFTREAAHSRSRVLHAQGDSTGKEMGRALAAKARTLPNITVAEHAFTIDLIVNSTGACCGIELLVAGERRRVFSRAVLVASGGAGQIYSDTTNPSVATGDGVAMAYRAGAELSDLEFFQFHPTALSVPAAPRFLLSEALRGEGALLLNPAHQRFMKQYDFRAELAPRDVVARAITQEISASGEPDATCFLDLRHLQAEHVRERFPRIASTCDTYGLDIATDLIPVRPAAHYWMGGVRTDLYGRTNLPNLFAAGECACTGVHGANRLASNSLLEGLVFGARAGRAMLASEWSESVPQESRRKYASLQTNASREQLQSVMWNEAAVIRSRASLEAARDALASLSAKTSAPTDRESFEFRNLLDVSQLLVASALAREESRGAHFRSDFPEHDDVHFQKHSIVSLGSPVRFE